MLRPGMMAVAVKLQEAADSGDVLSSNDIRARLCDAINDAFRGTGEYGYYIDHFGDGESGDVIFCCSGDTCKAPYEITGGDGAAKCVIDVNAKMDVVPRTIYEEEADEADHYAAMEESFKSEKLYTALPLYERFISKKERDAATAEDFAGKGRSFPILKREDIDAAVHSLGRAGSANKGVSAIKAAIIRIAKRKGWESSLPKAWQTSDSKESSVSRGTLKFNFLDELALQESAATIEPIVLREAKADYEIKLIAPGKGSSAFYPAEVLKRDGPKVFQAGTHVYLNHPTAAEESARPEGDVKNLAGVLATGAVYHEAHAKGPGLYARMKVFADHAQTVEEKAPHVGMSIRASGVAESGKTREGVPVLKELVSAESVDVVTRAGAGGMILTEAARGAQIQEVQMDEKQVKELVESAVKSAVSEALKAVEPKVGLLETRALRGDAVLLATRLLGATSLHEAVKAEVVANVTRELPIKEGALDETKFTELVTAEAKRLGTLAAQLSGSGRVFSLGNSEPAQDPAKLREAQEADEKEAKRLRESNVTVFTRLMGGNKKAAEAAVSKGEAA